MRNLEQCLANLDRDVVKAMGKYIHIAQHPGTVKLKEWLDNEGWCDEDTTEYAVTHIIRGEVGIRAIGDEWLDDLHAKNLIADIERYFREVEKYIDYVHVGNIGP